MDKKSGIIAIIALVIIIGGVFGVMAINDNSKNSSSSSSSNSSDAKKSSGGTKNSAVDEEQVDMTDKKEIAIDIVDFDFSEKNIKIAKGTTVTWTNKGDVEHNAQQDDVGESFTAPEKSAVKDDVFAGELLKTGETYSFTFNEAGEFPYHCAPHAGSMMANITVTE